MADSPCEASNAKPKDRAKVLILKTLGAKRVAGYVGVAEDTIYQGLKRGTDANPVPIAWVAKIVAGAKADGLDAPMAVLWPAMGEASR